MVYQEKGFIKPAYLLCVDDNITTVELPGKILPYYGRVSKEHNTLGLTILFSSFN